MVKNIVISWLFIVFSFVRAFANIPDISLNQISKSACRISAGEFRGSGVAVYADDKYIYVLTNAHVLSRYNKVSVEFYRYGAKTHPINGNVNGKVLNHNLNEDFAIITVDKGYFQGILPEIIPLAPTTYIIKPNTYFATAGNPFSRDMTTREGRIIGEENGLITFTPPPDDGQSGSGLFVNINGKPHVAGIITYKSGDYAMDMNGNPTTHGAAISINQLRRKIQKNTTYYSIFFPVNEQLYALGSDGKYYPQQGSNAVVVPLGIKIVQWNCPGGQCRPSLPQPIVPRPRLQEAPQASTTAPKSPFVNLPDGFTEEPITPSTDNTVPKDVTPAEPPETIPLPEVENWQNKYNELKEKYDIVIKEIEELKVKLVEKETIITNLEEQIKKQTIPELDLSLYKKEIEELKINIENKNKEIEQYKIDINILKNFIEKPEVIPEISNTEKPIVPDVKISSETQSKSSLLDKVKKLNPLWYLLAGIGGTLIFGKYIPVITILSSLFAKKQKVEEVVKNHPEYSEIISWLESKFSKNDSKLSALTDYLKSKVGSQNINIDIDTNNTNDTSEGVGLDSESFDYKSACQGKPVSDRIKDFFDLKKRDGESIEKWALFAILYREAIQILRKGGFEIEITGNKVPLQGQKQAADRIDGWVRDQFLKRTTVEKLDYNYLYHEAMIGFLYKEAVKLLRVGYFPVLGAKETANVVENWVRQEFLERMGITL